ncbi:MAG: LAGLIDADG family homing endonuclease [Clostridia bacterium]|nr:LAGLIDADG family homing endonuclease [Clostridia bacterium]
MPEGVEYWSLKKIASFLRGLFSANGCIIKHHRVSFKTTCKAFSTQLIELLADKFDITATRGVGKAHKVKFDNGVYECRECYDVKIEKISDILKFAEKIGFVHAYKNAELEELIEERSPIVLTVKNAGVREVYDFTEPISHWGIVEGIVVHNCGEIVGIDGSVCCLGHVNFATIVKDGKIDYKELERRIRLGIRFLDNCIDVNKYPHDKFKKVALATRTIGLGFAGFADMLIQLNIRYGSSECIELIDEIGKFFQETSHDESRNIMETRGNYPAFENKTPNRRNASTNTIAPTGSTAMIANVSYGVEPYFALSFIKNCMNGKQLCYTNKYFEELVEKEYSVNKAEIKAYALKHGTIAHIDKKLLPDYVIDLYATAHDIKPKDRVKVQAAWQKYIDLSISSTVNLPESATKEDVAEIYRMAWESGCKGITVYRDGSRTAQVLNIEKVNTNSWTCEMCGKTTELDEGIDASTICVKCSCGHKSCA